MARYLTGRVVSNSADQTIVVAVQDRRRHKIYDKQFFVTKRFKVHDGDNLAKLGDTVRIGETKPKSRHKRWQLKSVIGAAGEKA